MELWTDLGLGRFELRYVRDKMQREKDFLIVRDRKPWLLIEVKQLVTALSPGLACFQKETKAPHAVQMVMDLSYVQADCFARTAPVVVSART